MNFQRPYEPNLINVSLSASDWNVVLNCIAKQPWETVDPIMQAVRQQVVSAVHGGGMRRAVPQPPLSDTGMNASVETEQE